jgi:hypothetical protein
LVSGSDSMAGFSSREEAASERDIMSRIRGKEDVGRGMFSRRKNRAYGI